MRVAKHDLQQFRRAGRGGLDVEVVPGAPGADGFGEMQQLFGNGAAIEAAGGAAATGGDERCAIFLGAILFGDAKASEEARDFGVIAKPIQA